MLSGIGSQHSGLSPGDHILISTPLNHVCQARDGCCFPGENLGKVLPEEGPEKAVSQKDANTVVNSVNLSCVKTSSQCLGSHCVLDCRNGVGWASGIGIFSTLLFILRTEDSSAFCLAAVLVPFFFSSQT